MFYMWHSPSCNMIAELETVQDVIDFVETYETPETYDEWVVENGEGLDNELSLWYTEFIRSVECLENQIPS